MKNTCKTITLSALCLLVLCLLTSCKGESKYQTFRLYSEIKDEAYTDKSDIHYKERTRGNYMRTCAGFLKALNDRDVNSMKKFCADELLAMEGTDGLLAEIVNGFEGDITDTSPLTTDFAATKYSQWSKTDPVDYYDDDFIVFTTDQTYWISLSMYAVCGEESLIGINRLRILTIDKRFDMEVGVETEREDGLSVTPYNFADGMTAELVHKDNCGILVCFGDSDGYIAVNIAKGSTYNIYKLTGEEDAVSRDEIDEIDFTDEEGVYEILSEYEPYAVGEGSAVPNYYSQARFYVIEGSEKMLFVNVTGEGVPEKIIYASIFDPTILINEQKPEVLHSQKNKKT